MYSQISKAYPDCPGYTGKFTSCCLVMGFHFNSFFFLFLIKAVEECIWPAHDFTRTSVEELDDVILYLIEAGGHCIHEGQPGTLLFPIPEPARHLAFQKSVERVLKHDENRPRRTPPYTSRNLLHLSASRWNVTKTKQLQIPGEKGKSNQNQTHIHLSCVLCSHAVFSLKLHHIHLMGITTGFFNWCKTIAQATWKVMPLVSHTTTSTRNESPHIPPHHSDWCAVTIRKDKKHKNQSFNHFSSLETLKQVLGRLVLSHRVWQSKIKTT